MALRNRKLQQAADLIGEVDAEEQKHGHEPAALTASQIGLSILKENLVNNVVGSAITYTGMGVLNSFKSSAEWLKRGYEFYNFVPTFASSAATRTVNHFNGSLPVRGLELSREAGITGKDVVKNFIVKGAVQAIVAGGVGYAQVNYVEPSLRAAYASDPERAEIMVNASRCVSQGTVAPMLARAIEGTPALVGSVGSKLYRAGSATVSAVTSCPSATSRALKSCGSSIAGLFGNCRRKASSERALDADLSHALLSGGPSSPASVAVDIRNSSATASGTEQKRQDKPAEQQQDRPRSQESERSDSHRPGRGYRH